MKRRNTAVTAEETIWCLQRRLEGWTIRQISNTSEQALGRRLSVGTVHKRIEKELTNRKQDSGDALPGWNWSGSTIWSGGPVR
jgi:hypothetical protein